VTFRLETARLVLRPLSFEDVDGLQRVLGDPETMRYYPHPFFLEETERWIRWNLDSYERTATASGLSLSTKRASWWAIAG